DRELELEREAQSRRGPALAVAVVGVAWITMAVVGVTMFRPELVVVKRIAERAATKLPVAVAPAAFANPPPPKPTPPPTASPDPASWWRYTDPDGFSVSLPAGWTRHYRSANQVQFTSPAAPGAEIVIAYTTTPRPDQYADWQQQSAWKAGSDPAYHLIGIHRVSYRDDNAAEWEFTDTRNGQPAHYLDHGFISAPGAHAYSIELIAPAAQWTSSRARWWSELLATFAPAGGTRAATAASRPRPSGPAQSRPARPPAAPAGTPPSSRPPSSVITGLPTSVPGGLPTDIPTSLPTAFLPSAVPTRFPSGW
ncbi:MAG TPA: hypothetical protein VH478_23295, partial [Trebonia sp.]|nr:hypothetical protein [Trebonia sp.]